MVQFSLNYFSIAYSLLPMVIIGCYGYRKLNKFYKLHLLQALTVIILYGIDAIHFGYNNQWMYNIYFMPESLTIMGAAATTMKKRNERLWILAGFILFVVAYIAEMLAHGIEELFIQAIAIEAIPILVIYLALIYRASQNIDTRSMIWLCLGIVLYFGGVVPATGFIRPEFSWLSKLFQSSIIEPLGHLRYFLAALSLWLYLRKSPESNTSTVHG